MKNLMKKKPARYLSRRESQIMDTLHALGEADVAAVVERMPDGPTYDSVRVTLAILERKGCVKHRQDGQRYVYSPAAAPEKAKHSALGHLLDTFFAGSAPQAILTLLSMSSSRLSRGELDEIASWIEEARKEAP